MFYAPCTSIFCGKTCLWHLKISTHLLIIAKNWTQIGQELDKNWTKAESVLKNPKRDLNQTEICHKIVTYETCCENQRCQVTS